MISMRRTDPGHGSLIVGRDGCRLGMSAGGGTNDSGSTTTAGTIFSIARDGTGFTKVVSFAGSDGATPGSAMIQLGDSVFVGTTASGGRCGEGTVFSLSLTGDAFEGETSAAAQQQGEGASFAVGLVLLLASGWIVRRRCAPIAANGNNPASGVLGKGPRLIAGGAVVGGETNPRPQALVQDLHA